MTNQQLQTVLDALTNDGTHDSDANVRCNYGGCNWSGKRTDLGEPA